MTDKVQKIREEVEIVVNRRLNLLNGDYFDLIEEVDGFTNEIMDIIDSLKEEPVSDDLNEELEDFLGKNDLLHCCYSTRATLRLVTKVANHFANWQKQQMMKDAVDCTICYFDGTYDVDFVRRDFNRYIEGKDIKADNRAKLIIIKED